jgi:hypothetical protein
MKRPLGSNEIDTEPDFPANEKFRWQTLDRNEQALKLSWLDPRTAAFFNFSTDVEDMASGPVAS